MQDVNLSVAHVDWCGSRYRSYRPGDNSYLSYSGERRDCISPLLAGAAESQPLDENVSFVNFASTSDHAAGYVNDHQQYCFSRYRSYRAEDNTYQPFSGGPRRQCQ
ncbi:BA14K family protein [Mesorhizobium sp. AR10]|nr:BA14K family protein [Mesorhizobium sp. AR10]UVK41760.1 BA14K family protein [Mesorhizobium sp. AR10]